MGTSLIPPLGASGVFSVASQFTSVISSTQSYEVMAVQYLAELIKIGIDPYANYYQPAGISTTDYDSDLASGNVAIVALKDSADNYTWIPSTYITAYPNANGIPYTPLILGIDIGAIPNYQDLSALTTKLSNVVAANLGITPPVIKIIAVGKTTNLDQSDHNSIQAARAALITDSTTDYAKLLVAQTQLAACQVQVAALQAYIQAHYV